MADDIRVEVAYVTPERQFLREVRLPTPAVLADALRVSAVESECAIDCTVMAVGIWSKPATLTTALGNGDRVEIYRPLKVDPKENRRKRAGQGR
jgi:putative ubiquitin-RnfH superfamily antitoxin RatB of RatAB toxin-antitoxin module